MTHILIYLLLINGMLFLYFFKPKQVLSFIDLMIHEIKNLIDFVKNKHKKSQVISLDQADFALIEKIKKRMHVLSFFYLSENIIRKLSISARFQINYRTYITLCCVSAILVGSLGGIIGLYYSKSILLQWFIFLLAGVIGFYLPYIVLRGWAAERLEKIDKDIPFFIDLMLICLDSGLTIEQALLTVSEEFKPINEPLAQEFGKTYFELTLYLDQKQAFLNLLKRVPSKQLKTFIYVVIHNKDHGGSIYDTLHEISMTIYKDHMAKMTENAQKIPGRLTAILTICSIPILLIVVLGPLLPKLMEMFK